MDGQMTIFDFIQPRSQLDAMTDEELRAEVSRLTGLDFKPEPKYAQIFHHTYYTAKRGKAVYDLHFSNYRIDNHARFISVGYSIKNAGGGSPCDSMDEAVSAIKKSMEKVEEELRREKNEKAHP